MRGSDIKFKKLLPAGSTVKPPSHLVLQVMQRDALRFEQVPQGVGGLLVHSQRIASRHILGHVVPLGGPALGGLHHGEDAAAAAGAGGSTTRW